MSLGAATFAEKRSALIELYRSSSGLAALSANVTFPCVYKTLRSQLRRSSLVNPWLKMSNFCLTGRSSLDPPPARARPRG